MAQYNTSNVKLSNSQLIIKIRNKKWSYVTLNLSSNVTFNCNDETNFPHKSLFTNTQVSKIRKTFPNVSSANIKLSKTQLCKMVQLEGFLRKRLGPLLKTGLPLMKNVLKPLAKSVLIPLGLTAAGSETHATIRKKIVGSAITTLIISNEEMFDIMK